MVSLLFPNKDLVIERMTIELHSSEGRQTKAKWGPSNPHPLSQMKTELVWEGKYDQYGNRRELDLSGCSLPMQKIETIDHPLAEARSKGQLSIFEAKNKRQDDFRNRLLWGDNKLVMASLLQEFKGSIDLIYIDPPFDVGADFTMKIPIGDEDDTVFKDQSTLEMVAYRDTWGKGTDSYIHMMAERLFLMRELLSEKGSIFVHCDWRVSGLIRLLLDEVFGTEQHRNAIAWCYGGGAAPQSHYPRKYDSLFWYSKGSEWTFNKQFRPYSQGTLERGLTAVKGPNYELSESGAALVDWWSEKEVQKILSPTAYENLKYPTQKPEGLLKRIIFGHSNEQDLVADFFCGSGTTVAVAEKMNRRWIAADLGRFAIHTTRKRLIEVQRELHSSYKPYRSFDVYNLGRYERQWWQKEHLAGADEEHRKIVLAFYKSEFLTQSPSPWLHGRKGKAFVHVDNIDSLFIQDELKNAVEACIAAGGKEIHCLAWEFEMELQRLAEALAHEHSLKIKLIPIPREIMEKNRKEPPPFLAVAELGADTVVRTENGKRVVDVKLTHFLPSLAEIPTKELQTLKERAIKSGFDFIDFWAVDFEYEHHAPFNHHWQTFRTRRDRVLPTVSNRLFHYEKPGKHTICVKVIDTFGCDTTKVLEVKI